ncbi:MAG: pilus (MSHA type) biogenesis protein MshL [Sulfurimonas sp. RIFOXYD12_FULL_33_39]|uniref:pilus (MSHA type) biogenesis protein MshL n=1 Tax=unclassified Sulfurimonas TaxID=2623549 RepID=UPI0008B2AE3F|nr:MULTISPECIES: pilus (MSHA type) biogenesis protein MshL [unclassified Sulfurimonas]OHE10112.1 MAG: pilus (MSHA type) biogenesis protein MshL [Sulfurimonas sp. RIFOXYD12_FULL_33_39]OHE14667.1 MAG: pilus (MSHA type) biogenesis protein MshL [Sulfurimonas sp. RIFOXYD2_FULL_34_21]DAB28149.1 MAG TPA: pilus (MSHA type) biogenesis protein MshL [Sulfurimonas sp. UBA10385]
MKLINKTVYAVLLTSIFFSNTLADCSYELFNISSTKNTKIIDFVEQLSDECGFSIIISDPNAQEFLNTNLNKTNLNDLTIHEVLNIILKENNLSYTLENNILKISYLETKMFSVDYILSQRKSQSNTDITLSSEGVGKANPTSTSSSSTKQETSQSKNAAGKSGMKVDSSDEVQFWHQLDLELQKILNRPQDIYVAEAPIINKNAGIITVTATSKQMERLEEYLKSLQDKVQLQVLIDVQLLSVTLNEGQTTGVDWNQLYNLQNFNLTFNKAKRTNVSGGSWDSAYEGDNVQTVAITGGTVAEPTYGLMNVAGVRAPVDVTSKLLTISNDFTINNIIKFLKTQGEVSSISNPKVLTLNNQAALITAGTEYFYKITSTETLAGGTSGTQSSNETIQSVFAGVLLDITPEISDDNMITLKINPSLSETASDISQTDSTSRTMPPDLRRRQLSSVVTVKDGNKIILGGLINTSINNSTNKVPILGDIPLINYLFKYENKQKIVQELIIVIEPHIVGKEKKGLSLSNLGYKSLTDDTVLNNKISDMKDKK